MKRKREFVGNFAGIASETAEREVKKILAMAGAYFPSKGKLSAEISAFAYNSERLKAFCRGEGLVIVVWQGRTEAVVSILYKTGATDYFKFRGSELVEEKHTPPLKWVRRMFLGWKIQKYYKNM